MRKLVLTLLLLVLLGNVAAENGTDIKNVSLSMEFNLSSSDEVYFDDQQVGTGEFTSAEFPYIISQSNEYISGIVASSFIRAERSLKTENKLSLHREKEKAAFIVPLTYGDHFNVEQKETSILSDRFINQLSPSFSFFMPDESTVRTALDPNITLESSLEIGPGSHSLEIEKTGEKQVKISEKQ